MNYRSSYIKYSTSYFRPFIGSRSWRRSMSWMLVTMHSNISAYLWVSYFILTYTMCWSSYKLPDKSLNWDYIQLVTFGGLRTGKRLFSSWIHINLVDINMYIDILNGSFAFSSIAVSMIISITAAIVNARLYVPGAKMTPYEVSDFILHLKSLSPSLKVSLSTMGSSITSRYVSRNTTEGELSEKKEFVPYKW